MDEDVGWCALLDVLSLSSDFFESALSILYTDCAPTEAKVSFSTVLTTSSSHGQWHHSVDEQFFLVCSWMYSKH